MLENVTQAEIYVKFPVDEKFLIDMRYISSNSSPENNSTKAFRVEGLCYSSIRHKYNFQGGKLFFGNEQHANNTLVCNLYAINDKRNFVVRAESGTNQMSSFY